MPWRLVVPIISGFLTASICRPPLATQATPPAWVFRVLWPILYVLLGIAWYRSTTRITDILTGILVLSLVAWLILYNCVNLKLLADFSISLSVALLILIIHFHQDPSSKISVAPLLAWLLFAQRLQKKTIL